MSDKTPFYIEQVFNNSILGNLKRVLRSNFLWGRWLPQAPAKATAASVNDKDLENDVYVDETGAYLQILVIQNGEKKWGRITIDTSY